MHASSLRTLGVVTTTALTALFPFIASAASVCDNAYYPLKAGADMRYKTPDHSLLSVTPVTITNDFETIRVTKIEPTVIRLKSLSSRDELRLVNGKNVKKHWTSDVDQSLYCKPEGLQGLANAGLSPEELVSASYGKEVTDFVTACGHLKADRYSGLYLPKTLTPTSAWNNFFHIVPSSPGKDGTDCGTDFSATSTYRGSGTEKITVGKKTYQAIRVTMTTQIKAKNSKFGSLDTIFDPTIAYWVKGIGLVRIKDIHGNIRFDLQQNKK